MSQAKTITIDVTQDDIDKGSKSNCGSCPVAIALRLATGCPVSVWKTEWAFVSHPYDASPLPPDAVSWIDRFDCALPVAPATFVLPLPKGVTL